MKANDIDRLSQSWSSPYMNQLLIPIPDSNKYLLFIINVTLFTTQHWQVPLQIKYKKNRPISIT